MQKEIIGELGIFRTRGARGLYLKVQTDGHTQPSAVGEAGQHGHHPGGEGEGVGDYKCWYE